MGYALLDKPLQACFSYVIHTKEQQGKKKKKKACTLRKKKSYSSSYVTLGYISCVALVSFTESSYLKVLPKGRNHNKVKNSWVKEEISGKEYRKS